MEAFCTFSKALAAIYIVKPEKYRAMRKHETLRGCIVCDTRVECLEKKILKLFLSDDQVKMYEATENVRKTKAFTASSRQSFNNVYVAYISVLFL